QELAFIRSRFFDIREEHLKPFLQDFIEEIIADGDNLEVKYYPEGLLPTEIVKYSQFMDKDGAEVEGSDKTPTGRKRKTAPHAASGERFMDMRGAEGSAWTISISAFIKYPRS
ncbi:MAG: hypothetical protein PHT33_14530, partial [bacterium]|nr:hypothetical protein [bacterium]